MTHTQYNMEPIKSIFDEFIKYYLKFTIFTDDPSNYLNIASQITSGFTLSLSYALFISLVIFYAQRNKGVNFKTVIYCIICLIFLYGLEHLFEILQIWKGLNPLLTMFKLINAGFSWLIVIYCLIILPDLKKITYNLKVHKLFDSILGKIPMAVILLDQRFHIIRTNNAAVTLFQLSDTDLLNTYVLDLFDQTSCQKLEQYFNGQIDDQPGVLTAILATSRQTKQISVTVQTVDNVDRGKYLMTLIDVTQQEIDRLAIQQRKQEAEANAAYKLAILNSMQDGVITLTHDGKIERMNPKAEQILGYSFKDSKGEFISDIMAQATTSDLKVIQDEIQQAYQHLRQHTQHISPTYVIKNEARTVNVIEIISSKMHINGQDKYCLILHDITAQKQYEHELKSNQHLLDQITANIDAMIWIADPVTETVVYRSRSFHRLFETSSEVDYNSQSVSYKFVHPDDHMQLREEIFQKGDKGLRHFTYRIIRPSGEMRYMSLNSVFLTTLGEGQAPRVAGLTVDITELMEARQELQFQKDVLSQKCNELNNRNDKLDTFAHIIAHDLKAPLFAISNLSSWLKDDCSHLIPLESQGHLELLLKRACSMNVLLDDIFNYFFKSTFEGTTDTYLWNQLIIEIIQNIPVPEGLRVIDETGLTSINTNRILLRQVLSNLITNAIKYHDRPQQGHVYIRCHENNDGYQFSIVDDGPGIAPRFFDDIFKPLVKLQSRDEIEGSGMGLAIVKKIVNQQGGEIFIESKENHGATFSFTWPKPSSNHLE